MKTQRIDRSRARLEKAFYLALGAYTEQEAKKGDQWRDESIGQLYAHAKHEFEEIRRNLKSNDLTYLVHNACDVVMLTTILLEKTMEMAGLLDDGMGEAEGKSQ